MGYQTLACPESFAGTNFRSMEEEVRKKVDVYANELLSSLEDFEIDGVCILASQRHLQIFFSL